MQWKNKVAVEVKKLVKYNYLKTVLINTVLILTDKNKPANTMDLFAVKIATLDYWVGKQVAALSSLEILLRHIPLDFQSFPNIYSSVSMWLYTDQWWYI